MIGSDYTDRKWVCSPPGSGFAHEPKNVSLHAFISHRTNVGWMHWRTNEAGSSRAWVILAAEAQLESNARDVKQVTMTVKI